MLSKENKLPRRLFETVFKKTRSIYGQNFSLRYLENPDGKVNRFSVVVPKTVAKKATERNLIRRQTYVVIGKYLKNIKRPIIGIFLLKKGAAQMSFKEMETEINSLFQKVRN